MLSKQLSKSYISVCLSSKLHRIKSNKSEKSFPSRFISSTPKNQYRGASYIHHVGEQPLLYKNVGSCLQDAANNWPDKTWVVEAQQNERLTFSQVLEQADRLAASMRQLGLGQGDRLGICSPNSARWLIAMMAAARAGLVLVAINSMYQQKEMEYSLKKVGVKALFIPSASRSQKYYDMMVTLAPEIPKSNPHELVLKNFPDLKGIVIMDDQNLPGTMTYKEVMALASTDAVYEISRLQRYIRPDDGCNIQFTSGTTGNPKAAYMSHFNYVNNSFLVGKRDRLYENQLICSQVPLFHAFGQIYVIMASLMHGASFVLPSTWHSPEENLKSIIREKCTVVGGTPTMYVDLLNKQRQMKITPTTLRLAVSGGAPCSPQLFNDIKDFLGVKFVKSIFGMTETTAVSFQSLDRDSMEVVAETIGHVQEHTEVQVIDSNGQVVPFGTPGELCVRGYCNMLGYWGDPDKTDEIVGPDKWLKTGDQIILQEEGYGKIVGRLKDMIIRGGENIFPKEIEDFINAHPDVIETHVFGVKDDRLGEEICATIKVKEGSKFDQKTMESYCKGKIAQFKIPRYMKILDSFPKTGSGKIQKFMLKDMVESGKI